jgi:hypothetical protein
MRIVAALATYIHVYVLPPPRLSLLKTYLRSVVVDETSGDPLLALGHDNVSAVSPLPLDDLEPPNLPGDPAVVLAVDLAEDEGLTLTLNLPALLEVLIVDLVQADPTCLAGDVAEEPVRVVTPYVVNAAALVGRAEARGGLLNVDVGEDVAGGVGRLGGSLVLVDVECDAGHADALADQEADTLKKQDGLRAIRERLVL